MGRTTRKLLLSLLGLAAVIVITLTPLWPGLQKLAQPWLSAWTSISTTSSTWLKQVWHLADLRQENEVLRHQLAELAARQATSESIYKENEELRRLLALPTPAGYQALAVEVIGQQIDETGTSYLVNRGKQDGLVPGLAVVAGSGQAQDNYGLVLVGQLTNVSQHISSLTLITSSASVVLAKLAQSETSNSLATGEYNLAVRLKFLQLDQPVQVGEAVVTSNLNKLIPPGLLIGTVTNVDNKASELFQSAVVAPPVTLEQFRFLYVLKPR